MKRRALALITMLFALMLSAPMAGYAKDTQKDSGTTQVKSYTKKDGTVVAGYSRKKKGAADDTQQVKGYTKKDGTVVAGYSRKKPASK